MIDALISKYAFYILGTKPNMKCTIEIIQDAVEIEGDFCEVGTYIGGNCAIMGELCTHYGKDKKIYLYDSFVGLPYPTKEDLVIPGDPEGVERTGELKSTGVSVAPLEWVNRVLDMSGYKNYEIVAGWVQNTLPNNNINKLAFLRLDLDLYVPTKIALAELHHKVVNGGYVFVHDYATLPGCKQAVDEFLDKNKTIKPTVDAEAGGILWRVNG